MPITIGTLTSNVNVVDRPGAISEDLVEGIVRTVIARMKEELDSETRSREESKVPERMSETL